MICYNPISWSLRIKECGGWKDLGESQVSLSLFTEDWGNSRGPLSMASVAKLILLRAPPSGDTVP